MHQKYGFSPHLRYAKNKQIMEAPIKIRIPKPCHEDWNAMTPNQQGRFCDSCTKNVVDFTQMKTPEIQEYFTRNHGKKICGRFNNEQLESIRISIPMRVLYSQTQFHKMFLLALFVSMGTTLLSCSNTNGNKQSIEKVEIVEEDPSDNVIMGAPVRPQNETAISKKAKALQTQKVQSIPLVTTGDVVLSPSSQQPPPPQCKEESIKGKVKIHIDTIP
ncbi:MAG: hypothetical protein IPP30_12555 [Flavobacterium sp.]|nr:hypothetical protein [Flavobacterium sp.]